ncbi:HAMP domain-containing protein, partial [Geodermatophilus sabuli]
MYRSAPGAPPRSPASPPLSPAAGPRGPVRRFRDLRIAGKVLVAVATAVVVAVAVGLLGLAKLSGSAATTQEMYDRQLVGTVEVEAMRSQLFLIRLAGTNYAVATDPATRQGYLDTRTTAYAGLDAAADRFLATAPDAASRDLVADIDTQMAAYRQGMVQLDALADAGDLVAWSVAREATISPIAKQVSADLDTLAGTTRDAAAAAAAASAAQYADTRLQMIVALVAGAVLALAAGLAVARLVTAGLRRVQHVTEGLAAGDLTRTAGVTSRDEVGRMGASLDQAVVELRTVMASVVSSADAVAASSEELSASSAQISASAEE